MVIKITPQQAKKVNALLRKLCANYEVGNCLLLDDGEPCVCVQSISQDEKCPCQNQEGVRRKTSKAQRSVRRAETGEGAARDALRGLADILV